MWGRAVASIASFTAVVAAAGQGSIWLEDHLSDGGLAAVAAAVLGVAVTAAILLNKKEGYPYNAPVGVTVRRMGRFAILAAAVGMALIDTTITLYAAIALALSLPASWLYEQYCARHKQCLDCLASVPDQALVCAHCGFRFTCRLSERPAHAEDGTARSSASASA